MQRSKIGHRASVGDDCLILGSVLGDYVAINRRNYIQNTQVGKFSYTNFNTVIRHSQIGKFCSISWNVSIGGKDHDHSKVTLHSKWRFFKAFDGVSIEVSEYEQSSCILGHDVWVAANAVILRDVKIGNGAVIGAGAIVTRDVEPYSIVVGNPARKMKMRFDDNTISELENIAWWNWPDDLIRKHADLIYSSKADVVALEKLRTIANTLS